MKKVMSAGGVLFNKNKGVVVVSQEGTSWSLPKGKIEEGEDELAAAKREIYEETGIKNIKLIKKLGSYKRYTNMWKEITFFLFETKDERLEPIDPKNPEAIWVNKEEVAKILTHPKDKEFFLKIKKEI